jgi:hypothetical protein
MKLTAERDNDNCWIVKDELGHLVPVVQVFVSASEAERLARLFAAAPEMERVLEKMYAAHISDDEYSDGAVTELLTYLPMMFKKWRGES